ncbi:hypothetical protein EU513_12345 [Yimella sp. RIT 621]|uniref:hypothetical protein n=1 Tax=Yimella sp. RIT 621 TaxID=2510323 RepID=UPI00101DD57A|nr:hypothetical protein [Yimella sp. RIT 621]MCG8656747.1 hypothetical protein [Yimella sp. NH-Cas1]RYG76490.1 hypothetical protein EU513_12345 [Yimella sp. RIT 621]
MPDADRSLDRVLVADQRLNHARIALDEAVAAARADGASWQAIGQVLGMSRQAVFKRFGRPDPHTGAAPVRAVQPLIAATEAVFTDLANGRAASLVERMTPVAAAVLAVRDMEATWAAVERADGPLVRCRDLAVRTPADTGTELAGGVVVATTLECESGSWHGRVAWDGWDRIAGILIVPDDRPGLPF